MVSVSEVWKTWNEGFANKDSSRLAELLTDDFRFVSATRNLSRQEALDWTAEGGYEAVMDNLEVLYENDEVAVVCHSANSTLGDGRVMGLYTKKDGKISQTRIVRQAL